MLYKCIFCKRFSPNLQDFDDHLRSQCEEMIAWITRMRLHAGPHHPQGHGHGRSGRHLPVMPLAANNAFWEPYRMGGHPPPTTINFLEISAPPSSSQTVGQVSDLRPAVTDRESEETVTRLSVGSRSSSTEMSGERRRGQS